jgi:hypothetical protein
MEQTIDESLFLGGELHDGSRIHGKVGTKGWFAVGGGHGFQRLEQKKS